MKVEIEGMEKAQVFYGLAKDGRLIRLTQSKKTALKWMNWRQDDCYVVRVYFVVEDD
jgi:hypothetical protein